MKKSHLLALILLFLPALALVSCSDDNDLPKVGITVDFKNPVVNDTVYAVAGDSLVVNSVTVKNLENDKAVALTQVPYYIDGFYLGTAVIPPYDASVLVPEGTRVGRHILELTAPVLMVDKAPADAVLGFYLKVVESEDDIPDEANPSTLSGTASYSDVKK